MAFLRIQAFLFCLSAAAPAYAHGGFSFAAPARVHVSHASSYHGRTNFRASVIFNGIGGNGPYNDVEPVTEITVFSVPTDAQRYMTATGRALPASHSNILLPPATPKGDFTYIWENNGPE